MVCREGFLSEEKLEISLKRERKFGDKKTFSFNEFIFTYENLFLQQPRSSKGNSKNIAIMV